MTKFGLVGNAKSTSEIAIEKKQVMVLTRSAIVTELTDEELEDMRGGCHGDDNCDRGSGCDDSRRSCDFRGDDRFSFHSSDCY